MASNAGAGVICPRSVPSPIAFSKRKIHNSDLPFAHFQPVLQATDQKLEDALQLQ